MIPPKRLHWSTINRHTVGAAWGAMQGALFGADQQKSRALGFALSTTSNCWMFSNNSTCESWDWLNPLAPCNFRSTHSDTFRNIFFQWTSNHEPPPHTAWRHQPRAQWNRRQNRLITLGLELRRKESTCNCCRRCCASLTWSHVFRPCALNLSMILLCAVFSVGLGHNTYFLAWIFCLFCHCWTYVSCS